MGKSGRGGGRVKREGREGRGRNTSDGYGVGKIGRKTGRMTGKPGEGNGSGTGRNGKGKPVVVTGWERRRKMVRTAGMPRGRNGGGMRGHGKEREGKAGGGYGTGKRRKWLERRGCPGGEDGGGTGGNGKGKPVVVMGRENGGSGQNAGDAQGEKTAAWEER